MSRARARAEGTIRAERAAGAKLRLGQRRDVRGRDGHRHSPFYLYAELGQHHPGHRKRSPLLASALSTVTAAKTRSARKDASVRSDVFPHLHCRKCRAPPLSRFHSRRCHVVIEFRPWATLRADRSTFTFPLELELIQTHMTQKPMLRVEVGARAALSPSY